MKMFRYFPIPIRNAFLKSFLHFLSRDKKNEAKENVRARGASHSLRIIHAGAGPLLSWRFHP
jgi:hypothetical protein